MTHPSRKARPAAPSPLTAQKTISWAEAVLHRKSRAAPAWQRDPRWQAIIQVGDFIGREPEAVWSFIRTWGKSTDGDVRMAVATCLLEHLLQHHFDGFIARVEDEAMGSARFASTVSHCWKFGQAAEPSRAARLDRLISASREKSKRLPRNQRFMPDARVARRRATSGKPRPKKAKSSRRKARKRSI